MAKDTSKRLRNQVMYSIYVRNYSEEGTFKAVERDLDRIRELGVDIVWLLPIHPIGKEARNGTLGSPYAIENYREINPELGTLDDFKSLAEAVHARGMKIIIDVVYNHTSPDSWLARNHPQYFYRTPEGRMGNRIAEWGDIVDLDYAQPGLWDYQIDTLKMWAEFVDGFRCDVAPLIPLDFWLRARAEVAQVRPDCLWLSESVEPAFIVNNRARGMVSLSDSEIFQAFDVCYDYDIFEVFRAYLAGEATLDAYAAKVNMQEYIYPDNYVKLRYLENHDQVRAKSIIANELSLLNWTAFIYFQKGMTLLYAGQETANVRRPDLFNKDKVDWETGNDLSGLLQTLYALKKHPLLTDSRYRVRADAAYDMLIATHDKGRQKLVGVFSMRGKSAPTQVELPDGGYRNLLDGMEVTVADGKLACGGRPVVVELL